MSHFQLRMQSTKRVDGLRNASSGSTETNLDRNDAQQKRSQSREDANLSVPVTRAEQDKARDAGTANSWLSAP